MTALQIHAKETTVNAPDDTPSLPVLRDQNTMADAIGRRIRELPLHDQ